MTIPKTGRHDHTCDQRAADIVIAARTSVNESSNGNNAGEPKHGRQAVNSKYDFLVEEPPNWPIGACGDSS